MRDVRSRSLRRASGRGNFAIQSAPNDLVVDAAFFYFMEIGIARAFVERFACGLAVIAIAGQAPA